MLVAGLVVFVVVLLLITFFLIDEIKKNISILTKKKYSGTSHCLVKGEHPGDPDEYGSPYEKVKERVIILSFTLLGVFLVIVKTLSVIMTLIYS